MTSSRAGSSSRGGTLRRTCLLATALAVLVVVPVSGAETPQYVAGAPGAGDPFFPLAGNGGDAVGHHPLRLPLFPGGNLLSGAADARAAAGQRPQLLQPD